MSLESDVVAVSAAAPLSVPAPWPEESNFLLDPESRDEGKGRFSRALLSVVQGNILQGHGREEALLLPFRVADSRPRPAVFWREIEERITWAWRQRKQADLALRAAAPGEELPASLELLRNAAPTARQRTVFCGFALSARGMLALGAADNPTENRAIEFELAYRDRVSSFNAGMKAVMGVHVGMADELANWREPFDEGIDGVWLLASDRRDEIAAARTQIDAFCRSNGLQISRPRRLTTWRNPEGRAREPFGFPDGLSMPAFFVPRPGRDRLGGRWIKMPLSQALIAPEVSARHCGGSFMVLRQLEQDVAGFHARIAELGQREDELIGRDKSGCPMAPFSRESGAWAELNQFDFNADSKGARCPFHAHIRKVNPREEPRPGAPDSTNVSAEAIVRAQIVRRGMIYDPRGSLRAAEAGKKPWPSEGTGLMFMAFMSDIGRQFEVLQFDWIQNPDFPRQGAGTDALLAPSAPDLRSFVKPLGGEYLYAPSRCWFRTQAGNP